MVSPSQSLPQTLVEPVEDLSAPIGLEVAAEIRSSVNLPPIQVEESARIEEPEPTGWRRHIGKVFPSVSVSTKNGMIAFFAVVSMALGFRLHRTHAEHEAVIAGRTTIINDLKGEIRAHKEHQAKILALSQEYASSLPPGSAAQKTALSFYQQLLNFSSGQLLPPQNNAKEKEGVRPGKFVGLV